MFLHKSEYPPHSVKDKTHSFGGLERAVELFSFPLRYNYATAQVHYAFPFSLPQEIKPHMETEA